MFPIQIVYGCAKAYLAFLCINLLILEYQVFVVSLYSFIDDDFLILQVNVQWDRGLVTTEESSSQSGLLGFLEFLVTC